jgi:hypothetical protein
MRQGCLIAVVSTFGGLLFAGWYLFPRDYSDTAKGSPEYAVKWKEAFEALNTPEDAQARYPEVVTKRFDNGEWLFGIGRDSHWYRDGGTIVVKDSTGKIRAFFGHVCGPTFLEAHLGRPKSLEEFYNPKGWRMMVNQEYHFPETVPPSGARE